MDKVLKLCSPRREIIVCSINLRFQTRWNTRIKIKSRRKKRTDLARGCHTHKTREQLIKNNIRRAMEDVQRFISVWNTTSLPAAGSRSPRGWWMLLLIRWAADSSDPETNCDIPLELPGLAVINNAAKWRKVLPHTDTPSHKWQHVLHALPGRVLRFIILLSGVMNSGMRELFLRTRCKHFTTKTNTSVSNFPPNGGRSNETYCRYKSCR